MATYTSTQSGNWNSSSTWGGSGWPNAAGDIVNIGHVVTYNVNDDTTVLGNITINTNGALNFLEGSTCKLRIAGNLTQNGGAVRMRAGHQIRMHEGFGWTVNNVAGSNIDILGTVPNSETTLYQQCNAGDTALACNIAEFKRGDIISVYDYTNIGYATRTDEVFYVTGTDGGTVYFRRFVGPELVLASDFDSREATFTTSAEYFRPGMKMCIAGYSEVFVVESVSGNTITFTESALGSYDAGEVMYETGAEYLHAEGCKVYKIAATIAGDQTPTDRIDVSSYYGFSVGDTIAIGGAHYGDVEHAVISGIVPNGGINPGTDRLLLTTTRTKTVKDGGIVVKVNRDCKFIGSASGTPANNSAYIYILGGGTDRRIRIENFEMMAVGNNGDRYRGGLCTRSSYFPPTGTTNIFLNISSWLATSSNYNGWIAGDSAYYLTVKNCVVYSTEYGIGSFYNYWSYYTGNIALKNRTVSFAQYGYRNNHTKYNILEGGSSWGYYRIYSSIPHAELSGPESSAQESYMRIRHTTSPFYNYYTIDPSYYVSKFEIKHMNNSRILYNEYFAAPSIMKQFFIDDTWKVYNTSQASSWSLSGGLALLSQISFIDKLNGIPKDRLILYMHGYGESDKTTKISPVHSWKYTPKINDPNYHIGIFSTGSAFIGDTIKVSAFLRKTSTINGEVGIWVRNGRGQFVATLVITESDTWVSGSVSYTFTEDTAFTVVVGGRASTGNFWVDCPTMERSDLLTIENAFSNFWNYKQIEPDNLSVLLGGVNL